jgi:hypothetical protein
MKQIQESKAYFGKETPHTIGIKFNAKEKSEKQIPKFPV